MSSIATSLPFESSSTIAVVINFVNTALGGALGLMGNVYSASKLGIVWFSIGSFLSMMLTHFSIQFLCRSAELSQSLSTHNLARSYFGSKGSLTTKLFVYLGNWSFIVNIIQMFADFAPQILGQWLHSDSASFLTSRWFAVCIGLLFIFPWVLVNNIAKLEKLSTVCLVFAIFIFAVLTANASKCVAQHEIHTNAQWLVTDIWQIFVGLPTISWCWSLQFNAIPIYLTLHPDVRLEKINTVSLWSCGLLFVLYGIQGIAVYLVWADSIDSDFLTNLDHTNADYRFYFDAWLSTLTQFIICIACFFSIPIFAYESRTNLHSILCSVFRRTRYVDNVSRVVILDDDDTEMDNDGERIQKHIQIDQPLYHSPAEDVYNVNNANDMDNLLDANMRDANRQQNEMNAEEESFLSRLAEGAFICVSAALVALLVSDLNLCLTLAGATYGCYISYFLPSGAYIIAVSRFDANQLTFYDKVLKYIAIFSILYGSMVCIAGVIAAFI